MKPLPFFSFARLSVRTWDSATITMKRNTAGAFVFCRPCKNGTGKGISQYGQQETGAAILSQAGVQEIPALDGNAACVRQKECGDFFADIRRDEMILLSGPDAAMLASEGRSASRSEISVQGFAAGRDLSCGARFMDSPRAVFMRLRMDTIFWRMMSEVLSMMRGIFLMNIFPVGDS